MTLSKRNAPNYIEVIFLAPFPSQRTPNRPNFLYLQHGGGGEVGGGGERDGDSGGEEASRECGMDEAGRSWIDSLRTGHILARLFAATKGGW